VAKVAIRAPSVDALFDEWSVQPLERRPLNEEARRQLVDRWAQERKSGGAPSVELHLPQAERREGLEAAVAAAIHHDMETMAVDARRHWIRRSLRPRECRIGFALFFVALMVAALIDYGAGESVLGQSFVVLGWVALWQPATRVITAVSFRLARSYFADLASAEVSVRWEP
jgi:hypothetical protein